MGRAKVLWKIYHLGTARDQGERGRLYLPEKRGISCVNDQRYVSTRIVGTIEKYESDRATIIKRDSDLADAQEVGLYMIVTA